MQRAPLPTIDSLHFVQLSADASGIAQAQAILDASPRFHIQTGGTPAGPEEGRALLECLPPGAIPSQKAVYLLMNGGTPVGVLEQVSGWPEPGTLFVGLFLLCDSARGRGLGTLIFRLLEQRWQAQGRRRVRLAVLDNNPEGRAFWTKLGFHETGELSPYQERAFQTTVRVMAKELDPVCRPLPVLRGPRVLLRTLRLSDVDAIIDFYDRNAEALGPWEPLRPPHFLTERYWRSRVEAQLEAFDMGLEVRFVLCLHDEPSRVVGTVGLNNLVRGVFQAATLGYSLDATLWGKGIMHEALEQVIAYAFQCLGLHRVMANVMPRNTRSLKCVERLGFLREGYAAAYVRINGVWEDHILTSKTHPSWHPQLDGRRP